MRQIYHKTASIRKIPDALSNELTLGEKRIVKLFDDEQFHQIGLTDFLTARDIKLLSVLSKNLRKAMASMIICPGLFYTPFGAEQRCRLHVHQWAR